MLTFVIHDIANKTRELSFKKEFAEQNIQEYEVFPAIMIPSFARKGISLSHKGCVRIAKERGEPWVCILENDVWFPQKGAFKRFLDIFVTEVPSDADLYLGGGYSGEFTPITPRLAVGKGKHAGFFCYIVQERFYDTFLAADERYNIDHFLTAEDLTNAKCYTSFPFIALQHDGKSDNTGMVTAYNKEIHRRYPIWDGTH